MLAAMRGGMLTDLRHLSRNLRRSPASVVAAILTLSLTLGAGASIFAVVDAVLLTPPPFADPDNLVVLGERPVDEPDARPRRVTSRTLEAWQERAGSLATLAAYEGTNLTLTGLGAAERLSVMDVTPGFLELLGVSPTLGRTFTRDDVGRPVVVSSHDYWRTKLASASDIIGRQIVLGNRLTSRRADALCDLFSLSRRKWSFEVFVAVRSRRRSQKQEDQHRHGRPRQVRVWALYRSLDDVPSESHA